RQTGHLRFGRNGRHAGNGRRDYRQAVVAPTCPTGRRAGAPVGGMALERTLTLVKPDGVCQNLVGTVLERFEKAGLRLIGLKMVRLSRPDAERFYAEHKGKPFY